MVCQPGGFIPRRFSATSPVYYRHGDHLGLTSLITDERGGSISQARNLPFGAERWRSGNSLTDFGFTGQRREAGWGLLKPADCHAPSAMTPDFEMEQLSRSRFVVFSDER